jgi:hypothetical protein
MMQADADSPANPGLLQTAMSRIDCRVQIAVDQAIIGSRPQQGWLGRLSPRGGDE